MSAVSHNWRVLVNSREPSHWERGTEIEVSLPNGFRSRFAVYSVRTSRWAKDVGCINGGFVEYDCRYRIRDSETISDAQVKAGVRPDVVAEFASLDDVDDWLLRNLPEAETEELDPDYLLEDLVERRRLALEYDEVA